MSYHFYISKNKPFSYQAVLNEIDRTDVQIAYADEYDLKEEFVHGAKFYIPDLSTRGVSVSSDDDGYDVGINILASGEDYLLACQLAAAIASLAASSLRPEEEENELDLPIFKAQYDANWAEQHKTLGLNVATHWVNEKAETMGLSGCFRMYFIGPDIMQSITQDQPDEELLYERMIKIGRAVQFVPENVRIPGVYVVSPKEEESWEYIVILPNQQQLLLKTDYVIFYLNEQERHKIPYDKVLQYAINRFSRLDEKQFIFPDMPLEEFNQMIQTFEEVESIPKKEAVKKKWWQFGKN